MKLLILGGGGMAGHMMHDYAVHQTDYEVWQTMRTCRVPNDARTVCLDVLDERKLVEVLHRIRPDVVINAVGVLNQFADQDPERAIDVNATLPHKLAKLGADIGFRLIHISTDCVFSGLRGGYRETSVPDGITVYAKTKSLGEVVMPPNLTIRTSIIGPECKQGGIGLFHWFMQQSGTIQGYQRVLWNGVTTLELAKTICWCINSNICGLVHLAAPKVISKYVLLNQLQSTFAKDDVDIQAECEMASDRTLVNSRSDFVWRVPEYDVMLAELKDWMNVYGKGVHQYGH